MADELDYVVLPRKPVADGDATPDPGKPFALAWSTAFNDIAWWDAANSRWVNNNPLADETRPGLISAEDFVRLRDLEGQDARATYLHVQAVPEAEWHVVHQLGRYPAVTVLDSTGTEVEGDVQHLSVDELIVTFSGGFSGRCACS